jgi:hypothetical protein
MENGTTPSALDPQCESIIEARALRQLRGDLQGHRRVWFIVSHPSADVPALQQDFARLGDTPVETVQRPGAEVELLDRAGSA